jgi:hypothetical protein
LRGQIRNLRTTENAINVASRLLKHIPHIKTIRQQTAALSEKAEGTRQRSP